jgi:hypothetical protein
MADARIFRDLREDHDRQRKLLEQVGSSSGAGEERREAFEKLRLDLQAHAAAEEESLYATMLANPDLREDARHSVSEHKEVADYLAEMMDAEFGSTEWEALFAEMRHRYQHHILEEEREMFPAASDKISAVEEARITAVFERRKPKELQRAESHPPGDARE